MTTSLIRVDLSLLPIKETAMKTFHDYTDLQKANLDESEVESLLKYELVTTPAPPGAGFSNKSRQP